MGGETRARAACDDVEPVAPSHGDEQRIDEPRVVENVPQEDPPEGDSARDEPPSHEPQPEANAAGVSLQIFRIVSGSNGFELVREDGDAARPTAASEYPAAPSLRDDAPVSASTPRRTTAATAGPIATVPIGAPIVPQPVRAAAHGGALIGAASVAGIFGIIAALLFHGGPGREAAGPVPAPVAAASAALPDPVARAVSLARGAVDITGTAGAPYDGYLYDLPRSRAFARAWPAALAELPPAVRAANPWLRTLATTSIPNETLRAPDGTPYVLAWGCDPAACRNRAVRVAFNGRSGAVSLTATVSGRHYTAGSNQPADRVALLVSTAKANLHLAGRFPLSSERADAVGRYVATLPADTSSGHQALPPARP